MNQKLIKSNDHVISFLIYLFMLVGCRWLENIDAAPGISNSALQLIKSKPQIYNNVCLMLDGMHIKKHVSVEPSTNELFGFVDKGEGATKEEATQVLVLMVVSLKLHGRIPIGYYLINGISSGEQAELIRGAIVSLHSVGCHVRVVTMDGAATNQSMAEDLGCKINCVNIDTGFLLPGKCTDDFYYTPVAKSVNTPNILSLLTVI